MTEGRLFRCSPCPVWWVLCWAITQGCLGLHGKENPQLAGTGFGATFDEIHFPSNPSDRRCLQQMHPMRFVPQPDRQRLKVVPVVAMVNPGLLQESDYVA